MKKHPPDVFRFSYRKPTDFEAKLASAPEKLELIRRLEPKEFDLVAIGRALLSEPEWGNKICKGRVSEIAPYTKEALKSLI